MTKDAPSGIRAATDETRDALLDAALRVLHRLGARRARMEDVAAEAGVARATVYYHFHSREELIEALLERGIGELSRVVEIACREPDIHAPVVAVLRYFRCEEALLHLLIAELWSLPEEPRRLVESLDRYVIALIGRRIEEAVEAAEIPPVNPDVSARALFGLVQGVVGGPLIRGEPLDLEEIEPELVRMTRAALGADPVGEPAYPRQRGVDRSDGSPCGGADAPRNQRGTQA